MCHLPYSFFIAKSFANSSVFQFLSNYDYNFFVVLLARRMLLRSMHLWLCNIFVLKFFSMHIFYLLSLIKKRNGHASKKYDNERMTCFFEVFILFQLRFKVILCMLPPKQIVLHAICVQIQVQASNVQYLLLMVLD